MTEGCLSELVSMDNKRGLGEGTRKKSETEIKLKDHLSLCDNKAMKVGKLQGMKTINIPVKGTTGSRWPPS